jgi:uncharacterized protein YaaW (UPF0174 family)
MKKQKKKVNPPLCACGCRLPVRDRWSYKENRPVIFIHGHNAKGRKLSKETLKKLRVIWNSEEYKMKKRAENLGRKHSKKTLNKLRLTHNTEEFKTKLRTKLLGHPVSEETRRKISEANKRHWNDEKTGPRLRKNISKAVITYWEHRRRNKL